MWRVTRTLIRGQFANDDCFLKWIGANASGAAIARVEVDPLNNGGPNDKRLYVWYQSAAVKLPTCPNSAPDLVSRHAVNGWNTQAEADAVLNYELGQSKVIADNVKAANAAAVDPLKIAGDAASELADDAAKAAKSSWPWLVPVGIGVGAFIAWKIFK